MTNTDQHWTFDNVTTFVGCCVCAAITGVREGKHDESVAFLLRDLADEFIKEHLDNNCQDTPRMDEIAKEVSELLDLTDTEVCH